jgi:hypothetical protein
MRSSKLLSSQNLQKAIEEALPFSAQLMAISAYITMPAISWLMPLARSSKVTIVGRFSPGDLRSGASDIDALRAILDQGWELRMLSNLHAKIYLLDRSTLFVGSANLTANGLKLVGTGNIEAILQKDADTNDLAFIDHILASSTPLTLFMLEKMAEHIQTMPAKHAEAPDWPEDIVPQNPGLFVSDFPLVPPAEWCEEFEANPSLPFAQINRALSSDAFEAEQLFRRSKAYHWLIDVLADSEDEALYFGELSAALHDALADDPAPYRRDVKALLSNLLQYVDYLQIEQLAVSRPNFSQLVELV